jgi:hypothetical protein
MKVIHMIEIMMMFRSEEEEKEEKEVINWYTGAVKRKEETVSKVSNQSITMTGQFRLYRYQFYAANNLFYDFFIKTIFMLS